MREAYEIIVTNFSPFVNLVATRAILTFFHFTTRLLKTL